MESEYRPFSPPPGQTCEAYMADFFTNGGAGYIEDPTSTTQCNYCEYSIADEYLSTIDVKWSQRWMNIWIFFAFVVVTALAVIVLSAIRLRENPFPGKHRKGKGKGTGESNPSERKSGGEKGDVKGGNEGTEKGKRAGAGLTS